MIGSDRHVRAALDSLAFEERELARLMADPKIVTTQDLIAKLKESVDGYIIDSFGAGEGYEDDDWLATKVVGHKRVWDVETLEKSIPRGIFKNLVKIEVDGAKVDQFVREGKLKAKDIRKAFKETANKPYVKITKRSKPKGDKEAQSLAEQLA